VLSLSIYSFISIGCRPLYYDDTRTSLNTFNLAFNTHRTTGECWMRFLDSGYQTLFSAGTYTKSNKALRGKSLAITDYKSIGI